MKRKIILEDYLGKRFGERTVVGPMRLVGTARQVYCRCEKGHEAWVRTSHLDAREGWNCKTCHCRRIAKAQGHPMNKTPVYKVWANMRNRCNHDESYVRRGIKYDLTWESFETFFADMGHPPEGKPELDRKNGHKGYSKSNCRWASHAENNANRTNLRLITYGGKTMCVAHWEKYLGVPLETLRKKLRFDRPLSTIMTELGYRS